MRILRIDCTLNRTGDTRSPLYDKVAKGLFTKSIKIGGERAAGWPEHEVDAINAARVAEVGDDAIRALVQRLHEARKLPGATAVSATIDRGPALAPPALEITPPALKARAKREGFDLLATPDGAFFLCRRGHAKHCATLADVQAVLNRIGVQS